MHDAYFCLLNCELAFLLSALLFVPIGQFPPLYLAGLVIQIQCDGDDTHSKGDNDDDDDGGADSFIQSCPSTEDTELGVFEDKRITLPQPTKPTSLSHPPWPTEIFLPSMFG